MSGGGNIVDVTGSAALDFPVVPVCLSAMAAVNHIHVIGAGLAGCEAAWQVAARGMRVTLWEMRPGTMTPAHRSGTLAELVCSNSLGSRLPDRATGLLLAELQAFGSLLAEVAETASLPAGGALAVDRDRFSQAVEDRLRQHPLVEIRREEVTAIPPDGVVVLASGPLTSPALADDIARLTGTQNLAFFDAIAPVIEADSIDQTIAFRASRYNRGQQEEGDYLNCPLNKDEYTQFVQALVAAERIPLRDFEASDKRFFEMCLPVEVLAARDVKALAFGPMRPVGLTDPRTGRRPWGVVQLRQENLTASLYNMVGFQTNLKWGEQERVFRLVPGLQRAVFARLGQMHRNSFVCAPKVLDANLQCRLRPGLFLAGQIAGAEGYLGSVGTGLLAGLNAARLLAGQPLLVLPPESMLGAICHYLAGADPAAFQPVKAIFGLLPPLAEPIRGKRERYAAYVERARTALAPHVAAACARP